MFYFPCTFPGKLLKYSKRLAGRNSLHCHVQVGGGGGGRSVGWLSSGKTNTQPEISGMHHQREEEEIFIKPIMFIRGNEVVLGIFVGGVALGSWDSSHRY